MKIKHGLLIAAGAACLGGPLVPVAESTPRETALAKRVDRLEKRMAATTRLLLLQDDQIQQLKSATPKLVPAQELVGTNYDTGASGGSVRCPVGAMATGGGASFMRPQNGDHIVYSAPWVENGTPVGWEAAGVKTSGSTIDNLSIEVVCLTAP
jgi:hypothetical protein